MYFTSSLNFIALCVLVTAIFADAAIVTKRDPPPPPGTGKHPHPHPSPPVGPPKGLHPNPLRPITDAIVMGDSYSDSCNVYLQNYNATGGDPKYPFPTCPPPPSGRADQGRSWPEWIRIDQGQKEKPGSPPGGDPVNPSQWNIVNLAQSGAVCDNSIFPRTVPDIGQQTKLYQTHYNTEPAAAHIYTTAESTLLIMFIGTNDVTYIVNGTGSVTQETQCISKKLNDLHNLGFKRFLMVQNINLQDCPQLANTKNTSSVVNQNNEQQTKLFSQLTDQWNDGTSIDIFPAYDLFSAFYDHPSEYGFENVDQGCNACTNPDKYLWANALHPSSRAFHIFAKKVVKFTNGVRGQELINGAEGV